MAASSLPKDNPTGDAFASLEDDGRRFKVFNTGVGHFRQGAVVSAKDFGPGAQLARLIGLGAIGELTPAEIEAAAADPAVAAASAPITPQDATGNPHPHATPPGGSARPAAPLVVNPPDDKPAPKHAAGTHAAPK